jgi:tRNA A-37 threonylcarbamoyl transferase component Bud32/glycine cleavage system H lipoate-binding protein
MMSDLIGQSLGRYHILEKLGEGGMAVVYKAFDTRLERDVAVKVIRVDQFGPATLENVLQRFEREAKALAKLSHPNIVSVIDYGKQRGVPYLVMEYLPGGSLKGSLGQPIPWMDAARLLLPISRGLAYAHQHGIVHRDVKPSNILICDSGEPMLTDFGIAKILEGRDAQTLTGTGVGVGTPEYMAPEQWTGQAGTQADIYSLGVVFYELVTGRRPYTADTPAAVLLKQANDPLPRPSQFVPDLPERVDRVLLKALARNPEDRFTDMRAFSLAIEDLLSRQTLTQEAAVPPGTVERTQIAETIAVVEQEATYAARLPATPLPSQLPETKKRIWWPWAAGLGRLLIVIFVVIVVLAGGRSLLITKPSPSSSNSNARTLMPSPITFSTTLGVLIAKGGVTKEVVFAPNADWVILHDNTATWMGIPKSAADYLGKLVASGSQIKQITFTSNAGWVILHDNTATWIGIPKSATDYLGKLVTSGSQINQITFTSNAGWVILHDNTATWIGIPKSAADYLGKLVASGSQIKQITFTSNAGWVILHDNTATWMGIPKSAADYLGKLVASGSQINQITFTSNAGWVILHDNTATWMGIR